MDIMQEYLSNAELAFANRQYTVALEWFRRVLEKEPDHRQALSRAGAICIALELFDEGLLHFQKLKELEPENGDAAFNYGNACYFKQAFAPAFAAYVTAERLGCSDDVTPRLYFQLAMIAAIRKDTKSALVYLTKCEESDKDCVFSLDPDMISEKLNLFLMTEDYENAEKCADQLLAIAPSNFSAYMITFTIRMANRDFDAAEKLLRNADRFADMNENERFSLLLQKSSLYTTMAEYDPDRRTELLNTAIGIIKDRCRKGRLNTEQTVQIFATLADLYYRSEAYDDSIRACAWVLQGHYARVEVPEISPDDPDADIPVDLDEMAEQNMALIQEWLYSGQLDESVLIEPDPFTDEGLMTPDGEVYDSDPSLPAEALDALSDPREVADADEDADTEDEDFEISCELREQLIFLMISSYMAKDEYKEAQSLSDVLKHSDNKYFSYFGLYTSALTERELFGDSETTRQKYDEALAFFRARVAEDTGDTLAAVFRARLYAEQKKFSKAEEIALLLSDEDREAVLAYVEQCKKG